MSGAMHGSEWDTRGKAMWVTYMDTLGAWVFGTEYDSYMTVAGQATFTRREEAVGVATVLGFTVGADGRVYTADGEEATADMLDAAEAAVAP